MWCIAKRPQDYINNFFLSVTKFSALKKRGSYALSMAYLIFNYLWEFALGVGFPWTPSLPLLERVLLESSWGTACGGVPACHRKGTDQGSWVRAGYTAKTDGRERTGSMSQQSLRTQVRGAVCKLSVAWWCSWFSIWISRHFLKSTNHITSNNCACR